MDVHINSTTDFALNVHKKSLMVLLPFIKRCFRVLRRVVYSKSFLGEHYILTSRFCSSNTHLVVTLQTNVGSAVFNAINFNVMSARS